MPKNVAQKLIESHLVEGEMTPGTPIGLRIDQTLTQDATGTLVMLELEAMGLDRVKTEVSVQYVDHNIIQADHKCGPRPIPFVPALRDVVTRRRDVERKANMLFGVPAMTDFPRSLLEYQRRFADEGACASYLMTARWPEGLRCPGCGHDKGWKLATKTFTWDLLGFKTTRSWPGLRIPLKSAGDSERSRPPIPIEAGQGFR